VNIQSLSIVVPTGKCWNHCAFCVSHMHHEDYGTCILHNNQPIPRSYLDRIEFVRDEGCNSMILTGTAEPQQNLKFIFQLLDCNKHLRKPFYNITIQTTGSNLHFEDIRDLANAGVTTLALSISSFINKHNWDIIHTPEKARTMTLIELIEAAKVFNMNVRACFNLTDELNRINPRDYFSWCAVQQVDQATFRKIYADGEGPEAEWVHEHEFSQEKFDDIKDYIKVNGTPIARLPYGFIQYSVHGISTVIDDNCMSKDNVDEMKYVILRTNGHLYSRWDDTGSLIF
jgi:hypothetical protein